MIKATDLITLPVYLPNPKVCHMDQYHCCKQHTHCRLWHRCAQIENPTVCRIDCPSCTYAGCSLSVDQRKAEPVYIAGVIQENRIDLDLQGRYWQEQESHRKKHIQSYVFYNKLFGDYTERRKAQSRARYWKDPDYHRRYAREWYGKHRKNPQKEIDERFMPECRLQCENCKHSDCILPADWLKKAYAAEFIKNNPDYFQRYRQEHQDERRIYGKAHYARNKDVILERQRAHRQKPEVKAQRAEYDRQYRKEHPESSKQRKKRYAKAHPERVRAQKRAYYQKNKDKINAKRRMQRGIGKSNTDPAHREV